MSEAQHDGNLLQLGLSEHHHDRVTTYYTVSARFYGSECAHVSISHLDMASGRIVFEEGGSWGPVAASRRRALELIMAAAQATLLADEEQDE